MMTPEKEREYAHQVKYKREWWDRYFNGDLAYFWPSQLDTTEDNAGYRHISRDMVFAIAAADTDHQELHTAVAAYVWGLGQTAFRIGRTVRAFTKNVDVVESNLRAAADVLATDGAVAAYKAMSPGGAAYTKFMGPAYFTKFLFFAGYRNSDLPGGLRPLILDKRVASALRHRTDFSPKLGDGSWPSHIYEEYLAFATTQRPDDPEEIEIKLFIEGRAIDY